MLTLHCSRIAKFSTHLTHPSFWPPTDSAFTLSEDRTALDSISNQLPFSCGKNRKQVLTGFWEAIQEATTHLAAAKEVSINAALATKKKLFIMSFCLSLVVRVYLGIPVFFKLLFDEVVKFLPVSTTQVATYSPQVAKYEGRTQQALHMLGLLTREEAYSVSKSRSRFKGPMCNI